MALIPLGIRRARLYSIRGGLERSLTSILTWMTVLKGSWASMKHSTVSILIQKAFYKVKRLFSRVFLMELDARGNTRKTSIWKKQKLSFGRRLNADGWGCVKIKNNSGIVLRMKREALWWCMTLKPSTIPN